MEFKSYGTRASKAAFDTNASRRLAIETTQTIADLKLSGVAEYADVPAITKLLDGRSMPIAQVAKELTWNSQRAADALAQGGKAGLLRFSKEGGTTFVGLVK